MKTGEKMHVRSRADEGNGERWFWLNCTIVEKGPEVEAMLIEPTTDGTGRLLKEYQTKNYRTHLSLGHMHGRGIKRALEGDLFDEEELAWSSIPRIGNKPCWICAMSKMTNRHQQQNPYSSQIPLRQVNVNSLRPFKARGLH